MTFSRPASCGATESYGFNGLGRLVSSASFDVLGGCRATRTKERLAAGRWLTPRKGVLMTERLKAAVSADARVLGLREHQLTMVLQRAKRRVPGFEKELRLRAELRVGEPPLSTLMAQSVVAAEGVNLDVVYELLSLVVYLRLQAHLKDTPDFHPVDGLQRARNVVEQRVTELRGSFPRDPDEELPAAVKAVREMRRSRLADARDIGRLVQNSFNDVLAFLPRVDD